MSQGAACRLRGQAVGLYRRPCAPPPVQTGQHCKLVDWSAVLVSLDAPTDRTKNHRGNPPRGQRAVRPWPASCHATPATRFHPVADITSSVPVTLSVGRTCHSICAPACDLQASPSSTSCSTNSLSHPMARTWLSGLLLALLAAQGAVAARQLEQATSHRPVALGGAWGPGGSWVRRRCAPPPPHAGARVRGCGPPRRTTD